MIMYAAAIMMSHAGFVQMHLTSMAIHHIKQIAFKKSLFYLSVPPDVTVLFTAAAV